MMNTDRGRAEDPRKILYEAGTGGDAETVRRLLREHGELLEDRASMGMLFRHAATEDQVEILAILSQEFGVDVNSPKDESTPEGALDDAAGEGALEAVRWLLDHGAKVNHQVDGRTRCFALSSAAFAGHLEIVELLVERGADVNAEWAGKNALTFALMAGEQDIADFLRSRGAVEPGKGPAPGRGRREGPSSGASDTGSAPSWT